MRFPIYSLKTGVLAHLAFLIVSAMLLLNLVMVKFAEKDLLQAQLQTGQLLLYVLGDRVGYAMIRNQKTYYELGSDFTLKKEITQYLKAGGFSDALMVDKSGARFFSSGSWDEGEKMALSLCRETLATKEGSFGFYGSTWGVIWIAHKRIKISAPIVFEGHSLGAITICADLAPLYKGLRKSEKVILIYILLNTIVLVLVGSYLLSRIVVKPIHKLLRITEEFKEEEPLPYLADPPRNEIGQLFRSLNMMLKRLDENKKELKAHISSLEKANEDIRKAQNEIIRSEKLASVGRLAAGVAHEIGNPIGIILGYLELLKEGDLSREDSTDFLGRIESEITRINQIIRQLLDFSRSESGERKQMSVHHLMNETISMLKPQPMMAHIRIQTVFEAQKDTIRTDPNQLKQVFLNIIMNAADAMALDHPPDDGSAGHTLTISTANKENTIELRFTDTGPGIPEEEIAHIFDPFYTTKEPGMGTGLGLSVCYRIIEELGGAIRAANAREKGATIIIIIPLHG